MDRTSNAWVKMIAAKILASSFKVQFELLSDVFSTIFGPFLSIIMGLICYFKMSLCRGRLGLRRLIGLWDSKAPISLRLARYIIVKVYEGHVSWPLHSLFSLCGTSAVPHIVLLFLFSRVTDRSHGKSFQTRVREQLTLGLRHIKLLRENMQINFGIFRHLREIKIYRIRKVHNVKRWYFLQVGPEPEFEQYSLLLAGASIRHQYLAQQRGGCRQSLAVRKLLVPARRILHHPQCGCLLTHDRPDRH